MPNVTLSHGSNIITILLVSTHPLTLVAEAAAKRGIETKQVRSYKELIQVPLGKWSVCITDMLPVISQWRYAAEPDADPVKVKKGSLDGYEVLQACLKQQQPAAVFAHALRPEEEIATYAAGSIGFFRMSEITPDSLLDQITGLLRTGDIYINEDNTNYDLNTLLCLADDTFFELKKSELDVIIRLVSGHSYERIGADLNIIPGTLRNKISKMLSTVEMTSREDLIEHAQVVGVSPLDDDELPENMKLDIR